MAAEDDFEKVLAAGHSLDSLIPKDLSGKDRIQHADDAMDFESEDELAEEEESASEAPSKSENKEPSGQGEDWTDTFAEELGLVGDQDEEPAMAQLRLFYPGFEPHAILKMNELFGPKPSTTALPAPPRVFRPVVPQRPRLDADADQRLAFSDAASQYRIAPRTATGQRIVEIGSELDDTHNNDGGKLSQNGAQPQQQQPQQQQQPNSDEELALEVADWDDVLDDDSESSVDGEESPLPLEPAYKKARVDLPVIEADVYNSDDEAAILDETYRLAPLKTQVDMNDPHLLFIEDRTSLGRLRHLEPRYNVSNDRAYDMLRENYQKKVRSTIGSLNIDHSLVALRLQSPLYKVHLTKSQMRAFHRPRFVCKPGTIFTFTPCKMRKKRKDKAKTIQQLLATSADLTLGDSAPLFLVEYSEEFPLILNNVGMGSKVINYYRKKTADDVARPKLPLGETHVLDVQDRSAFWNFGFVEPGNVVPTLYNQMVRAPVFRHEPRRTDFLVVRSTSRARGTRYFLRPVPYLFVAGQEFPVAVVPGPHSRKVTAASKNRLKMIVYRLLNKDPYHRLQVRDISPHFPDQNDMQNRQRLKEFMEYQRSGEDQGYWKIKQGDSLPTEEAIRQMISPEDVALLESMQMGQQHLQDSGYTKTVDDDAAAQNDDDGGQQQQQSLEEQLAPWNLSRNFVNAVQGKAMLQLHGDGDPTARGEGFSFLRTSMKGGFKTGINDQDVLKLGGHSYNVALQQRAYDEEIKRIWYAQAKSLQVTDPAKLPADHKNAPHHPSQTAQGGGERKVLQITRMVRDANGILQRRTELVTDANLIRAYMKRRQATADAQMAVNDIAVTDDAESNRQKRKFLEQELARLHRNLDRRQARKATKGSDGTPKGKATTRKCATCGAVGHIKTNKACPMFNDIYLGGQPK